MDTETVELIQENEEIFADDPREALKKAAHHGCRDSITQLQDTSETNYPRTCINYNIDPYYGRGNLLTKIPPQEI